jgi:hypothetical protein
MQNTTTSFHSLEEKYGHFPCSTLTRHNKSRADVINEKKMTIWNSEGSEQQKGIEMKFTFRDHSLFICYTFYAYHVLLIFLSPERIPNQWYKHDQLEAMYNVSIGHIELFLEYQLA